MQFERTFVMSFSPTGGTRSVADIFAKEFGVKDVYEIVSHFYGLSFHKDDLVIFCFPVYGGRVPKPVYDRFAMIDAKGAYLLPVAVFGNRAIDDSLLEMSDIGVKSGFTTVGGIQVIAPHSLNKEIAADRPDDKDKAKIHEFVEAFKAKPYPYRVIMPGNRPYIRLPQFKIHPRPGHNCMLCCTCAKECPAEAIEGPKAARYSKCISCMRCVSVCMGDNRHVFAPVEKLSEAVVKSLCSERKEVEYWL